MPAPHVHRGTSRNDRGLEIPYRPPTDDWAKETRCAHTTGCPSALKSRRSYHSGPRGRGAQRNQPDTERRVLAAVTCVWNLKPSNSQKWRVGRLLAGGSGARGGGGAGRQCRVLVTRDAKSWRRNAQPVAPVGTARPEPECSHGGGGRADQLDGDNHFIVYTCTESPHRIP